VKSSVSQRGDENRADATDGGSAPREPNPNSVHADVPSNHVGNAHESQAPVGQPSGRKKITLRNRVKRMKRHVGRQLVTWFGPIALRALASTWKITLLGEENIDDAHGAQRGRIMAMWHGRILPPLPYHARRDWRVLVSRSGDGDITSNVLERFGYRLVRGSSTRGGARALREMLHTLKDGSVLVVTPDGPRGPRHAINPGLVWIARATGYAVIPCGVACDRAWRTKTWDRFTIPKPGAHLVFVYGAPILIGRETSSKEMDAVGEKIRAMMIDAELRGFAHLEEKPDW